jgi:hypothetical protein
MIKSSQVYAFYILFPTSLYKDESLLRTYLDTFKHYMSFMNIINLKRLDIDIKSKSSWDISIIDLITYVDLEQERLFFYKSAAILDFLTYYHDYI